MKKYESTLQLANEVWDKVYTQVPVEALQRMDVLAEKIRIDNIPGDIVECGVWAGGSIIYLANLFPNHKIWACDSFDGFQEKQDGNYQYDKEVHTKQLHKHLDGSVWIRYAKTFVQRKEVFLEHLKEYEIGVPDHVEVIEGYFNQTLKPEVCPIKEISLLRVDADAYSATREVLDFLYDKVVVGGYIIFDDWGVPSADAGMFDFFNARQINALSCMILPPSGCRCATMKKPGYSNK